MNNWIIFIIFTAVLIGVGVWSGRKIKSQSSDGSEGFLLGGKQIGAFIGAGTLIATGYSGWGFIGSPGTAYAYGTVEVLANFFYAPAIAFGSLVFASFMRKRAKESGGLTIPEYLAKSHHGTDKERRTVHFIAGLATFIFLSVHMMGQIRAVGLLASEWLGTSQMLASVIIMVIIMTFTVLGGLLAVAVTDTIMCMGMIISALVVFGVVVRNVSLIEMFTTLGNMDPELINPTTSAPYGGAKYSVFLVFVYALLFTTTLSYMSVRFLSLKENIKIHKMVLYMAPMGLILSLIPFAGLFMRYTNPGLSNPDSAMPVFLNTYLSPAMGGIITLFILFAMLSTISSILQTLAASLSHDMFVSIFNRESKYGDLINRVAVIITALWGIFLTFVAPQGMLNQIAYIGTGGLIAMLVGPTIMRRFLDGNLKTCLLSMVVGFILNIVLIFQFDVGWVEAPIFAGLAGSIAYLVLGYVSNGYSRKQKRASA